MKGRKVMTGLSLIRPEFIHEAEFAAPADAVSPRVPHRSRKPAVLVLAACLMFALALSAYAANLLGIQTLFRTPYRQLPEDAAAYIQEETIAAEAAGWSCEITETLADNATVMATVVIHGGDKYIVVPTDAGPGDLVGIIGIPENKTLGDYALEKGKTLLFVGASITKVGDTEGINGSQRMENISDNEMVILTKTEQTVDTSSPNAVCTVYALEDGKNDVERIRLPFTLNTAPSISGEMIFHPIKPDAIPGLTVGDLHITETALGYNVLMPETVTDWNKHNEIMKVEIEGLDNAVGGSIQHDDGSWYFEVNMCQGTVGDALIIHYYDWDKQPIGDIEFRRQINNG